MNANGVQLSPEQLGKLLPRFSCNLSILPNDILSLPRKGAINFCDGPLPRYAGVTALGLGGADAHVILEKAPTTEDAFSSRPDQVLMLSAKTETALDAVTERLQQYMQEQQDVNLAGVAYTLQVDRGRGLDRAKGGDPAQCDDRARGGGCGGKHRQRIGPAAEHGPGQPSTTGRPLRGIPGR